MEMDTMYLRAKEVGLLESPPQAIRDRRPLYHIGTARKSLMRCRIRVWHYEALSVFFDDKNIRLNQKRKVRKYSGSSQL